MRGADRKPLGIVHRDISPGNILLGFDGGVKVVDFGIAKTDRSEETTKAGELKGKVGYMSPEQCKALPLDRRTDIYMLGIVLYELCTVRRLFKGENRYETMQHIVEGNVAPPSRYRKDMPDELERIIMKALATDPADRYQTADDLRLVLEAFATRANFQISPSKLSDYLKDLFGERLEPWLLEAPPPEPTKEEVEAAVVVSPELIAEAEASITRRSLERIEAAKPPPPKPAEPAAPAEPKPLADVLEPGSGDTPMAWPVEPAGAGRRRLFFGLGAVALAGGIAVFALTRGGEDTGTAAASSNKPAETASQTPSTNTAETKPDEPKKNDSTAEVSTPPSGSGTGSDAVGSGAENTVSTNAGSAGSAGSGAAGSSVDENDIVMTNGKPAEPGNEAVVSGATKPGGTKPGGTKPGGTKPGGTKPGGTKPGGTKPGGTKPAGDGDGGGVKIDRPTGPDLDAPMPD
jgi:hypothetical protein